MGNVLKNDSAALHSLECQLGQAKQHPALGFVCELEARFVGDLARQDAAGRPKWRLARPNANLVTLNPEYDLSPEEAAVHKLWFLYQSLRNERAGPEASLREFFWFSDYDTRCVVAQRVKQPTLSEPERFRDLRRVFESWQAQSREFGDPAVAVAVPCALKTGSLRPLPRVLEAVGPVTDSPRVAVQLFASAMQQTPSLCAMRDELLRESNRRFACAKFRRALLCPEDCTKKGATLERARHVPRSVLWDLLQTAGLPLSVRTPTRVLDLLYREILCPEIPPKVLLWAVELQDTPNKLQLVLLREKFQDLLRYARRGYLESAFEEQASCEEFVDKLLEHGCVWLLDSLSPAARAEVLKAAGCGDQGTDLEARLREALSKEFLESWLRDRGVPFPEGSPVDALLEKYRTASFGCLFGQGDCPDPEFPRLLRARAAEKEKEETKVAEGTPDENLLRALRLFTLDFNAQDREDAARLERLLRLLELDDVCGDAKCDDEELASKVATKLLGRLDTESGRATLCQYLGNQYLGQQASLALSLPQAVDELSRRNRYKIAQMRKASVLLKLVSAAQQASLVPQLTQLDLGKAQTEEQARALVSALVDDYVSREYFLRVARLQLARPVTDEELTLSVLTPTAAPAATAPTPAATASASAPAATAPTPAAAAAATPVPTPTPPG
jgi:hypothetical protein